MIRPSRLTDCRGVTDLGTATTRPRAAVDRPVKPGIKLRWWAAALVVSLGMWALIWWGMG
jgi:hypothetical protein